MNNIDNEQEIGYWYYNENDKTVQFHLRTVWSPINDITIVYDMINKTFSYDTRKYYNYMVKADSKYYGLSWVNTSIYEDDKGYTDAGEKINFLIRTQWLKSWTGKQAIFIWLNLGWSIWPFTTIKVQANIDGRNIFEQEFSWDTALIDIDWPLWEDAIWEDAIGWWLLYESQLQVFDKTADQWRIYQWWDKMMITISSNSLITDFLLDTLWYNILTTEFNEITDKF